LVQKLNNFLTLEICQVKKNDYLYYVIMRKMNARQIALKDIGKMVNQMRNEERHHYHNNQQIYTINIHGPRGGQYDYQCYETYIFPAYKLNTKENRRLNRELGI